MVVSTCLCIHIHNMYYLKLVRSPSGVYSIKGGEVELLIQHLASPRAVSGNETSS